MWIIENEDAPLYLKVVNIQVNEKKIKRELEKKNIRRKGSGSYKIQIVIIALFSISINRSATRACFFLFF